MSARQPTQASGDYRRANHPKTHQFPPYSTAHAVRARHVLNAPRPHVSHRPRVRPSVTKQVPFQSSFEVCAPPIAGKCRRLLKVLLGEWTFGARSCGAIRIGDAPCRITPRRSVHHYWTMREDCIWRHRCIRRFAAIVAKDACVVFARFDFASCIPLAHARCARWCAQRAHLMYSRRNSRIVHAIRKWLA